MISNISGITQANLEDELLDNDSKNMNSSKINSSSNELENEKMMFKNKFLMILAELFIKNGEDLCWQSSLKNFSLFQDNSNDFTYRYFN